MTSERKCEPWRCGDDCWGLPGCQHPERTPFYEIPLPRFPPPEDDALINDLFYPIQRTAIARRILSIAIILFTLVVIYGLLRR
jgi:hypothetical protein